MVVCAADGANQQSVWKLADLAALTFASKKDKTHVTKFRAGQESYSQVHKQLWPDCSVPGEHKFNIDAKQVHFRSSFLPTSGLVAAVLHLASHGKRSPPLRKKAFEILRRVVEQLCALDCGLEINVMVLSSAGRVSWRRVLLQQEPYSADLWGVPLGSTLQFAWNRDRNDESKPWVSSLVQRPHLAEWLMFCMDLPARMCKMERSLAGLKRDLQPGVLSVISEIAFQLDAKLLQLSCRISDFKQIAKRSDKLARWASVGSAADKLWDGSAILLHLLV